jgi:hypothetical protein
MTSSQDTIIRNKLFSLKKSKFRSKFELTPKDRDYTATKGLETIKDHAFDFVNSRVAPDFPKNDGKQTPIRALNAAEVDYAVALIMGWIERQINAKRVSSHKMGQDR